MFLSDVRTCFYFYLNTQHSSAPAFIYLNNMYKTYCITNLNFLHQCKIRFSYHVKITFSHPYSSFAVVGRKCFNICPCNASWQWQSEVLKRGKVEQLTEFGTRKRKESLSNLKAETVRVRKLARFTDSVRVLFMSESISEARTQLMRLGPAGQFSRTLQPIAQNHASFDRPSRDASGPRAGTGGGARGPGAVRAVQGGEPRGGACGAPLAAAARAGAPDAVAGTAGPAVGGAAPAGIPARVVPRRVPGGGDGRAPRRPPLRRPPSRPPRAPHHHHSLLIVSSRSRLTVPSSISENWYYAVVP